MQKSVRSNIGEFNKVYLNSLPQLKSMKSLLIRVGLRHIKVTGLFPKFRTVNSFALGLGSALLIIILWSSAAAAQELTPRAYWPAPNGTNVVSLGYQYTTGDVVTDPTLPITGVAVAVGKATLWLWACWTSAISWFSS